MRFLNTIDFVPIPISLPPQLITKNYDGLHTGAKFVPSVEACPTSYPFYLATKYLHCVV